MRGQVEENIRQLGRDHLDVVNLRQHGLDSIEEHFGALAELREAGLIRHLGISNILPEHIAQAQAIAPVVCVQNRYGIGARSPSQEAMLARCEQEGIAFVPFFSIAATGGGAGRSEPDEPAVVEVAQARGVSPAQIRIAWTLHKDRTFSRFRAPATPSTSTTTSPPARCASPTTSSPPSTPSDDLD